jgi:TM2 domain-containing membrane protein YozV
MNEEHPHDPSPHAPPVAPEPGAPMTDDEIQSKKILCGVLGIVLGGLGIHKFILGRTSAGIIMVVVWALGVVGSFLCVPALASIAMSVIGLVEGIIYLTKTNAEFKRIYIDQGKDWF